MDVKTQNPAVGPGLAGKGKSDVYSPHFNIKQYDVQHLLNQALRLAATDPRHQQVFLALQRMAANG